MFSQLYTQKNKNKYLVYEWEYHNNSNYKIRKWGQNIITTVELVIVGMEQFLPLFVPCEMLNLLPEVLFVLLVNDKVWVSHECVW